MDEKPVKMYTGPERRTNWHTPEDCSKIEAVQKTVDDICVRLEDGDARMARIEKNQEDAKEQRELVKAKLDTTVDSVDELLDILRAAKGFFTVLGMMGNVVKWAAAVAAPVIALWFTLKGDVK